MKLITGAVLSLLTLPALLTTATAQTGDFQWRGTLAQGDAIEIRGVNGSIRALPSDDGSVHVEATRRARRSDPESVRIEVVEHAGGVTVCAVYPTPAGARRANACRPGSGAVNNQNNDVQVDFVVRIPAGVALDANTVNGTVQVAGLSSDVRASTVNGGVEVETTGFISRVSTVNGNVSLTIPGSLDATFNASTLNGSIDSDFPITMQGRVGPRTTRGTIGAGGREMRISTLNGNIRLSRL